MLRIRPAAERGHANYGWLDTWHSFSFADYYDPAEMGWGTLRVINDDIVAAGKGFATHGHRDMEIVTVILEGSLQHKDSMGNGTVIRPGEVQRMSAGKGVMHSEFNPETASATRLLQIWIEPNVRGGSPSYEQTFFADADKENRLCLLASGDGREGSVRIQQEASLYASRLASGKLVRHEFAAGRLGYLHLISGRLRVNGCALGPADGAKIRDEAAVELVAEDHAEFLLFDLGEH